MHLNKRTTTVILVVQNHYFVGLVFGFQIFVSVQLVSLYESPHMLVKTMSGREAAKRDTAWQNGLFLDN